MPKNTLFTHCALRRSIDERTLVHFADHEQSVIKAYVDSGEGLDRAGGFAIQVYLYTQHSPILAVLTSP